MKSPASCLAHDDVYNQLAVGSWNSSVSLYDYERSDSIHSSLTGHTSGVTFLKYSSCKQYLIAGARKSSKLVVWDLRNTTEPLTVLHREVQTNQKIYFDITSSNDWLVSGGTDGHVRVWNFKNIIEDQTSVRVRVEFFYICFLGFYFLFCFVLVSNSSRLFKWSIIASNSTNFSYKYWTTSC